MPGEASEALPEVLIETLVSSRTGDGRVNMTIAPGGGAEPHTAQFSAAEARQIGTQLIEAARAASYEARVIKLLAHVGLDITQRAHFLHDMRKLRREEDDREAQG